MFSLIIGNCQVPEIAYIINKSKNFTDKYGELISIKVIDYIDLNYYLNLLDKAEIVIAQPINDNFKIKQFSAQYLIDNVENLYFITNCYFYGYHPEMIYLYNFSGTHQVIYEIDYHDRNILTSFKESKPINILDPDYYSADYNLSVLNNTLDQLKKREHKIFETERKIDICISDWIENNYQKQRLFNTFNHPSTPTLVELSNRILTKLEIQNDLPEITEDLLSHVLFPIYPSTAKNLELEFKEEFFYRMKHRRYTSDEAIGMYQNMYTNVFSQEIVNHNYNLVKE